MSETATVKYLSFVQRKLMFLGITALALLLVAGIAVTIGSYDMTIVDVYRIIAQGLFNPGNTTADLVVWNIRLPRILMGILAGAGLGICGAVLQAILRNPLASPFTLGITSAATFGASLAMILGIGIFGGSSFVVINAFVFTLIASFAIYALAFTKKFTPGAIIMAGIAISYLFGALTSFLQYIGTADALQQVVFWAMGSLGRANWFSIQVVAVILAVTLPILLWYSMDLNVMGSGDEAAKSMGVDVSRVRIITLVLTSLITAGIICFTGTIGFIGLVGPHICRMIVGPDHRFLLPASALMGALILLCADIAARTLFAPQVIPIGIMTSFIGVPFFIYLFVKRRGMYW
ncbi:MAG: iron ABC transporter permease [Methanoregula sp.]|nr:iron ABC transporter permease [Methanoregula sp.]